MRLVDQFPLSIVYHSGVSNQVHVVFTVYHPTDHIVGPSLQRNGARKSPRKAARSLDCGPV
jgi:hypothetical protein